MDQHIHYIPCQIILADSRPQRDDTSLKAAPGAWRPTSIHCGSLKVVEYPFACGLGYLHPGPAMIRYPVAVVPRQLHNEQDGQLPAAALLKAGTATALKNSGAKHFT